MMPIKEPQPARVWSWYFPHPMDLRRALEEYTAFQEGTLLRKYGHDGFKVETDGQGNPRLDEAGNPVLVPEDPSKACDPEALAEAEMHAAQRRSEIDACMEDLRRRYPHWWRLLDVYYRRGLSMEPRGWVVMAALLGVHKGKCPPLKRCPASPGDNRIELGDCERHQKNHCHWDRDTFERQVVCAIRCLFDIHRVRSERVS